MCVSPYAGGVDADAVRKLLAGSRDTVVARSFWLGVLNPGRTGFLVLGTNLLLDWRLHAVAAALLEKGIDICVMPGARMAPGVVLPLGFPFVWIGCKTVSWAGVGVFCRIELIGSVHPIEDMSEDRVLWLEVWSDPSSTTGPTMIICCGYPGPGGDLVTWKKIIDAFTIL